MVLSPKPVAKLNIQFTTIDFDDVNDGDVIDNHYSAKGVTFASVTNNPPNQWNAFARSRAFAKTPPNVVSVNDPKLIPHRPPEFDNRQGGIQATFAKPQQHVSIDACPVIIEGPERDTSDPTKLGKPWIAGFDAQGKFLGIDYYPLVLGQPGWGDYRTLFVYSPIPLITTVIFSCHPSDSNFAIVEGLFDRLVFTDSIPRTASILLGAGG